MAFYRQAICPVCGTAHGVEVTETVPGKRYIKLQRRNYWERVKGFDPAKPFGVIQETSGRGSFKLVGYFGPEEDKDGFFPLVKARLLAAVKEWVNKGWITRAELRQAIK
jgi:hypothetical protein